MRNIKIGCASIDTCVGAFKSNTEKVIGFAHQMNRAGCTLGCFQEQVISGYPCEDLIQWRGFVAGQWKEFICFVRVTKGLKKCVFTLGVTFEHQGHLYNCVAVVLEGNILGIVPKENLPTYGVFYEKRTFSSGIPGQVEELEIQGLEFLFGDIIFWFPFGILSVEVCEDIWTPAGPMVRRAFSGAELNITVSDSPFHTSVLKTRREMLSTRSADNEAIEVYTNQFGGQDSLVFDGGCFVCQNGRMLLEGNRWEECWTSQVVDLDKTARKRHENTTWRSNCEQFLKEDIPVKILNVGNGPGVVDDQCPTPIPKSFFIPGDVKMTSPQERYFEDLLNAMVTGLGGYFEKTGAFKKIGIALSGGKDSLLTLVVAWMYAMKKFNGDLEKVKNFIHCFSMPTDFNSENTKNLAREASFKFGVSFKEIPIREAFCREKRAAKKMLNLGEKLTRNTLQNIQARIRAARMWNWANSAGGLWIHSGNMSETAVGYTTIGGDLQGGYSLIKNLPKTVVIALLEYLAKKHDSKVLQQSLKLKASAELEEDQNDERDLMPFPILDACLHLFVEDKLMPDEMYMVLREMFPPENLREMYPGCTKSDLKDWVKKFIRLFILSIFKWEQSPQGVHLGNLDLDRSRALQIPIVQSREWLEDSLAKIDRIPD